MTHVSNYYWIQRLNPNFSSYPVGGLDLTFEKFLFMLDNKIIKKNISKNNQQKLLIKKIINET
jgi:hypothetical protein